MEGLLKKFKQIGVTLFILVITIEVSPYIISPIVAGQSFSREEIQGLLQGTGLTQNFGALSELQENTEHVYLGRNAIHPYIGFVANPGSNRNELGFPGPTPLVKSSADEVHICLTGGSVAIGLYGACRDRIATTLSQTGHFKDKKIRIVLVALAGFKQPQQLMSLNYFMALGAEYDLVINLDGFNEIALPFSDNLPFGVFPSFPRHWNMLSRKGMNSSVLQLIGQQAFEQNRRERTRKWYSASVLRHSNFGLFLWRFSDNKRSLNLYELEGGLRKAAKDLDKEYQSVGPDISYGDTTQYFEHCADLWRNASAQMGALEQAGSFNYFHFLQPNQYVDGSKVLTGEELTIAYEDGPLDYKTAVVKGYPFLVRKGKELMEMNINFTDLSMLFKEEQRSVYQDKCCHFNQLGNEIIADRITTEVIKILTDKKTSSLK